MQQHPRKRSTIHVSDGLLSDLTILQARLRADGIRRSTDDLVSEAIRSYVKRVFANTRPLPGEPPRQTWGEETRPPQQTKPQKRRLTLRGRKDDPPATGVAERADGRQGVSL